MEKTIFIGCDISKHNIDFYVVAKDGFCFHSKIENKTVAINAWIKLLAKKHGILITDCWVCMEHTGIYNNHLLRTLASLNVKLSVIHASQIKMSLGMQRGKSDKVDAQRIAEYGMRFSDKLDIWQPKREVVEKLKKLASLRERLVKAKVLLSQPINEAKDFEPKSISTLLSKHCKSVIKAIELSIEDIENEIDQLIFKDEKLSQIRTILVSIPGIGKVTSTELIIRTNEFKDFNSAKKLACHAGVVPFENSSGTSLKGKSKVSHRAQKSLKTLLNLAAMAAIKTKGEFQQYFQRKVEEGKNKMSVLNAVRNKLIRIAFTIVKNQVMYQKKYNLYLQEP
jgi:transposase